MTLLSSFNPQAFLDLLRTRQLGRNFCYFESLPSTNDHARTLMEEGKDNVLVLAESQSAGRGRQGRQWDSPKGTGLYFSLGIRSLEEGLPELLTLRVGLVLARVVEGYIQERVWVKWPNDLWIEGKKAAGILVESRISGNRPEYFVIGVGINMITPPEGHPHDRHYLFSEGRPYVREEFLALLMGSMEADFHEKTSLKEFYPAWDRYDMLKNKKVRVITGQGTWEGIARGIDKKGDLLVEREGKLQKVTSGEVSIRPQTDL